MNYSPPDDYSPQITEKKKIIMAMRCSLQKKNKRYMNPEKKELNSPLKIKSFLEKAMLELILEDEEKVHI